MARGKGKYNKDCERSRQEIKQMIAKYSGGINGFEKRSLEKNHPSLIGRIIDENRKNKLDG